MKAITNKFLLAGDKLMPEMQPGFTYSAYEIFTKNKKRIQTFKATGGTRRHLSKRTRQGVFSSQYDLCCIQISTQKNNL